MTHKGILYAAGATTAIAGILHLILVPMVINFNVNSGIFFIVSGAAQIFWALPMIKQYGRVWYVIGIIGTLILIALWAITRVDANPITGRAGPINEMGIAVESFQVAYIILASIMLAKGKKVEPEKKDKEMH
ncbi:MAG: hypothetical protein QW416_04750 [Candidatus Nitrosocaldaceae archaeon]